MRDNMVSCEEFREKADALLAEILEPSEIRALLAHKDTCEDCRDFFGNVHALVEVFPALPSHSPRPHVIENLERSIEVERQAVSADTLWNQLLSHPARRLTAAIIIGFAAALLTTISFGQAAASLVGLSQTLFVCALFWGCGYTGMFSLTFRHSIHLQDKRAFDVMREGKRISIPVLIALGIATMGLFATFPFGGIRLFFAPPDNLNELVLQPVPYTKWFTLGILVGVACLLIGTYLGNAKKERPLFRDGILTSALFVLMITPGFAIICVPFTFGLFLTVLAGLSIGAFSGGIFGIWSLKTLQTRNLIG